MHSAAVKSAQHALTTAVAVLPLLLSTQQPGFAAYVSQKTVWTAAGERYPAPFEAQHAVPLSVHATPEALCAVQPALKAVAEAGRAPDT